MTPLALQWMTLTTSKFPAATSEARAIREGYRSGLEVTVAKQLAVAGVAAKYEDKDSVIEYIVNETRKYHPDFKLPNGIIVETKGRFTTEDRKKHKLIKEQHPELDIRFVFTRSKTKISKTSPTTYAMWCDKLGFKYADKLIPPSWLIEETK